MGGFTIADPENKDKDPKEQNAIVLTFEYFKRNPNIEFPDITAAELDDRSTGDALSKLIAIIQTSCFILQCIARGQQNLAITELELVTLALASLNAVTFLFWWYKPLALGEPVRLYRKTDSPQWVQGQEGHATDESGQEGPTTDESDQEGYTTDESDREGYTIDESDPEGHTTDESDQEGHMTDESDHDSDGYEREDVDVVLSFREVLSTGAKDLGTAVTLSLYTIQHPCEDASFESLFVVLPINTFYVLSSPIFMLFPLGIIVLLMIIRTDPVDTSLGVSENRGLIISQIMIALKKFRYRLTSSITKTVGTLVQQIFQVSESNLWMFRWYILLPTIFVLLLLFLVFFLIPLFVLIFLISFIFNSVFGIITTSEIHPGATHVPSFYATKTKSDRWSRMVVFAIFGVVFGGIHCIGWYFTYPSQFEQTLWQTTSATITVIPFIVAPIDFILTNRNLDNCGTAERTVLLLLDLVMTILLFIYVPARLSLLTQAVALLRHQPAEALLAVDWTRYIPHVFS